MKSSIRISNNGNTIRFTGAAANEAFKTMTEPARTARPNGIAVAKSVQQWNENHPVGTAVEVTLDDGSIKETKTASEAWLMGGHSAVIKLEGISGGYSLDRVKALVASK